MAYALTDCEPVGAGITRILREEISGALAQLDDVQGSITGRVHECRKHLKKSRSLMRLVRRALPSEMGKEAFNELRDAARALAGLRENAAHLECIDALIRCTDDRKAKQALRAVKKQFSGESTILEECAASAFHEARSHIAAAQMLLDGHEGDGLSLRTLQRGIGRSYGAARKAYNGSQAQPTLEQWHEWRKRTKDLRYQCAVIACAWPACLNALESEMHALTDHLGLVHDLLLLAASLEQMSLPGHVKSTVAACAAQCCDREKAAAFSIGKRVFMESRTRFSQRMAHYLSVWAAEHALPAH